MSKAWNSRRAVFAVALVFVAEHCDEMGAEIEYGWMPLA
jgi:hypothetical protein